MFLHWRTSRLPPWYRICAKALNGSPHFLESYRPPLDGERYLTDREVAELLRVSRRTLQEYRNNRVLPFILLGGKVLYPESGLRELLEANYRKPLE